jgi:hypothetical protein
MKLLNSHPFFYATIGYDLSFNKKEVLSRKKKEKTNLTGQIHKAVICLLDFLPLLPTDFGPKMEQWKLMCGIIS